MAAVRRGKGDVIPVEPGLPQPASSATAGQLPSAASSRAAGVGGAGTAAGVDIGMEAAEERSATGGRRSGSGGGSSGGGGEWRGRGGGGRDTGGDRGGSSESLDLLSQRFVCKRLSLEMFFCLC